MYFLADHINGAIQTFFTFHSKVKLASTTCLQRQLSFSAYTSQPDSELTWMMNTLGFPMREGQLRPLKYLQQ